MYNKLYIFLTIFSSTNNNTWLKVNMASIYFVFVFCVWQSWTVAGALPALLICTCDESASLLTYAWLTHRSLDITSDWGCQLYAVFYSVKALTVIMVSTL